MRVAETDVIAGVPAELARAICRKFRGREMVAEIAEDPLAVTGHHCGTVFAGLEAGAHLGKIRTDNHGDVWWDTTSHRTAGPGQVLQGRPARCLQLPGSGHEPHSRRQQGTRVRPPHH